MSRKLLTMAIVLVAISITSTIAYAGGDSTNPKQATKVESSKTEKEVQINVNSENGIQTEGDVVLITIKGKKGSSVTLEVYLNSDVSIKEELNTIESLIETAKAEDYSLILSEDVELNDNGVYPKEIELKKGLYKIVVTKKDGSLSQKDVRYILCKGIDDAAKTLDDAKNAIISPVIDTIKKLISNK
ncbi:hypothetical protein [Proteiniborus sp. MB09-C3]|uniref:hypothetical protein n=1 Tax=Proteiniborus sp. MB09-C3 TaxID=3050072 RepID=UPI002554C1B1|nr:hypothetical protein [Proteiniborus sp. MB09-C3]WIV12506.1 hypothetical protein QO263_01895 [Proteiniborus sp. MB09-C3]